MWLWFTQGVKRIAQALKDSHADLVRAAGSFGWLCVVCRLLTFC